MIKLYPKGGRQNIAQRRKDPTKNSQHRKLLHVEFYVSIFLFLVTIHKTHIIPRLSPATVDGGPSAFEGLISDAVDLNTNSDLLYHFSKFMSRI